MKPGYYIVTHGVVLRADADRLRVRKDNWLVTDGVSIGIFDKTRELDWVPLEWAHGIPVSLDDSVESQLSEAVVHVPFRKIEMGFRELTFVEPGELEPEMPTPVLSQLGAYLRERRLPYSYLR